MHPKQGCILKIKQEYRKHIWIAIILFSLIARIGVTLYYGNWVPPKQDDHSYASLAQRLATGHGYTFGEP